jgi:transposase
LSEFFRFMERRNAQVIICCQQAKLVRGAKDKEPAMSQTPNTAIAVIGIDIGKNSFHVVGHDARAPSCCGKSGRVAKWKRGSPIYRLA